MSYIKKRAILAQIENLKRELVELEKLEKLPLFAALMESSAGDLTGWGELINEEVRLRIPSLQDTTTGTAGELDYADGWNDAIAEMTYRMFGSLESTP